LSLGSGSTSLPEKKGIPIIVLFHPEKRILVEYESKLACGYVDPTLPPPQDSDPHLKSRPIYYKLCRYVKYDYYLRRRGSGRKTAENLNLLKNISLQSLDITGKI